MADGDRFAAGQIALTGVAQKLSGMTSSSAIALKNTSTVNKMYVGQDNTVSAASGWPIDPGETFVIGVLSGNKLWVFGTAADRLAWSTAGP